MRREILSIMQNILYTTGPYIEHAQLPDPHDPTYEYCIYLKIEESFRESGKRHSKNQKALKPFFAIPSGMEQTTQICQPSFSKFAMKFHTPDQLPILCFNRYLCNLL